MKKLLVALAVLALATLLTPMQEAKAGTVENCGECGKPAVLDPSGTDAVITLSGVTLNNEGSDILLSVCDDGWSGAKNIAELKANAQPLTGTILVGDNSTLTLTLSNGSSFEGCISGEIVNAKGTTISTEVGTVSVNLDSTSTWTLTADTYITSFEGDASNVIGNGYTLYVNGTALQGIQ